MKIHIVKQGDSLYGLAQKYQVSLEHILQLNPEIANPDVLTIGMKVKIPSNHSGGVHASDIMHQHVVKQGDTLWKLSKAWGVPLATMVHANPQLKNPNVLLTGEIVNIPKAGATVMPHQNHAGSGSHSGTFMQSVQGVVGKLSTAPVIGKTLTGMATGKKNTAPIADKKPTGPVVSPVPPAPEPKPAAKKEAEQKVTPQAAEKPAPIAKGKTEPLATKVEPLNTGKTIAPAASKVEPLAKGKTEPLSNKTAPLNTGKTMPLSESNVSPLSSNVGPLSNANISPLGTGKTLPLSDANVSPLSSNVGPLSNANISPLGTGKTMPLSDANVSPLSSNVGPLSNANISPLGTGKTLPLSDANVSPLSNAGPLSNANVSPLGTGKTLPLSNANVSPLSSNVGPLSNANVSPLSSNVGPLSNANVSPLSANHAPNANIAPYSAAPIGKKALPNEKPVEQKVSAMNSEYFQSMDLFQQYPTPAVEAMSNSNMPVYGSANAAGENVAPASYGATKTLPATQDGWGGAQTYGMQGLSPYTATEPVYPYDCPPGMVPHYPVSPYSPYGMAPMWGYGNSGYQGLSENANISPASVSPNAHVAPASLAPGKGNVSPLSAMPNAGISPYANSPLAPFSQHENAGMISPYSAMPNQQGVAALSAQYPPPGYAGYPGTYPTGYPPVTPFPTWQGYSGYGSPSYSSPGDCGCGGIRDEQLNGTNETSGFPTGKSGGNTKAKKKTKKAVIRNVVSKPKPKTTRGSRPWLNR